MREFTFKKEGDRWFIVLPEWKGDKEDLEMVYGADTMLDILSQGEIEVNIPFSLEPYDSKFRLEFDHEEFDGSFYNLKGKNHSIEVWLCAVTKYVFGFYPQTIYCG